MGAVEDSGRLLDGATPDPPSDRAPISRLARRAGIGAVGGVVVTAGIVMLVTPGPGLLVMALGLAILGREFPAALRPLRRLRGWRDGHHEGDDPVP